MEKEIKTKAEPEIEVVHQIPILIGNLKQTGELFLERKYLANYLGSEVN